LGLITVKPLNKKIAVKNNTMPSQNKGETDWLSLLMFVVTKKILPPRHPSANNKAAKPGTGVMFFSIKNLFDINLISKIYYPF